MTQGDRNSVVGLRAAKRGDWNEVQLTVYKRETGAIAIRAERWSAMWGDTTGRITALDLRDDEISRILDFVGCASIPLWDTYEHATFHEPDRLHTIRKGFKVR